MTKKAKAIPEQPPIVYPFTDIPDKARHVIQSAADEVNTLFPGHAFVLIDDDDMKKIRKLTVAPVIAVMYGGMQPSGSNSGANTGARTTGQLVDIEIQIFIIGDTELLCEKPTQHADFKMLPTLHAIREHLRHLTLGCNHWRYSGEGPQDIGGVYGFYQSWRGSLFLFN